MPLELKVTEKYSGSKCINAVGGGVFIGLYAKLPHFQLQVAENLSNECILEKKEKDLMRP